jgi:hypothetical protein
MSIGRARKTTAMSGARKSPTVRRPFSNRSSFCRQSLFAEAAIGGMAEQRLIDVGAVLLVLG